MEEQSKKIEDYPMSYEEFCSLATGLEICHSIFYSLWGMVRPYYSYSISTASVRFDSSGNLIQMMINPDYFSTANEHTKLFIIAHEMTHVILYHGIRALDIDPAYSQIANVAMDLCVNHMLVDSFGFHRGIIRDQEKFCWLDTVFEPEDMPKEYLTFEGYFTLLKDKVDEKIKELSLVDDHSSLSSFSEGFGGNGSEQLSKEIAKTISRNNSKEEIKDFLDKIKEVKAPKDNSKPTFTKPCSENNKSFDTVGEPPIVGILSSVLMIKNVKIKPKWESVIKKWTSFILAEKEEYQWVKEDRRFSIVNKDSSTIVPQMNENIEKVYEKIDIWFFLDTSGSCDHLRERFLKAALSLNPKKFNIKLFSRTTEAREVLPGEVMTMNTGGSDSYQCMEDKIHEYLRDKKIKEYPHAIFHITDGHDCDPKIMTPLYPERWHFFLTPGRYTNRLPAKVNIYNLEDYE